VNGRHKYGNDKICNEFTERFQSVLRTNTMDGDNKYESELQNVLHRNAGNDNVAPKVDIGICLQALTKIKFNKSPGFDNMSAEHLAYGSASLHVHLCLLFNTVLQHCYVPQVLALV